MSAEDKNKAHFKIVPQTPDPNLSFQENPFDRFPFSPVLEKISKDRGLDLGIVRGSLTVLARAYHRDVRPGEQASSDDLAKLMQAPEFRYQPLSWSLRANLKSNKLPVAEQRRYIAAVGDLGAALEGVGDWSGYLSDEMNSGVYRNDGARSISPNVAHLTVRTFEAFSEQKKQREEASRMVGIEEVRPQGYPSDSLTYPNVRGNRTRRRQQWGVVQATETNSVNRKRLNIPPAEPAA